MGSKVNWDWNLNLLDELRLAHDQARAAFRWTVDGPMAHTARRAALIYLPHLEREENTLFPVLALAPELAQGHMSLEMAKMLPVISQLSARHDSMNIEHQWMLSAVDDLLRTAHRVKNTDFTGIAYTLKEHERIESEIAYPAAMMIGNVLREMLAS